MGVFEIDGKFYDTKKAVDYWESVDALRRIRLYKSSQGYFYMTIFDRCIGSITKASSVSKRGAAEYLVLNGYAIPDDLKEYAPTTE